MGERGAKFGLTLPNRGVITGATTMEEMPALARWQTPRRFGTRCGVGDSTPSPASTPSRCSGLGGRDREGKVRTGLLREYSIEERLAARLSVASLDYMSGGRTIFVACQGQPAAGRGGNFAEEFAAFGIDPSSRMRRMEEAVEIMRLLTSEESASYEGEYNRFENVTVLPRPVQQPVPISRRPTRTRPRSGTSRTPQACRPLGDGWQTTWNTPESFAQHLSTIKGYAEEEGRDLGEDFEACLTTT